MSTNESSSKSSCLSKKMLTAYARQVGDREYLVTIDDETYVIVIKTKYDALQEVKQILGQLLSTRQAQEIIEKRNRKTHGLPGEEIGEEIDEEREKIRETYPAILKSWDESGSPNDATLYK